jgi:hypothetical protein
MRNAAGLTRALACAAALVTGSAAGAQYAPAARAPVADSSGFSTGAARGSADALPYRRVDAAAADARVRIAARDVLLWDVAA